MPHGGLRARSQGRKPGRLRSLLELYLAGAWLVFAVTAVPFLVQQIRQGLHPAHEQTWTAMSYESSLANLESQSVRTSYHSSGGDERTPAKRAALMQKEQAVEEAESAPGFAGLKDDKIPGGSTTLRTVNPNRSRSSRNRTAGNEETTETQRAPRRMNMKGLHPAPETLPSSVSAPSALSAVKNPGIRPHCHKLEQKTGVWLVASAPEK